jgi:GNAT superfamily N-acetyltransferase
MAVMLTVSSAPADDQELLRLINAMTAEVVSLYELEPAAHPAALGPDARYLLARLDGQGVGCCAVRPVQDGTEVTWELKRMFVTPAARGAGVAWGLLERAEEVVRGLGGERMRLETGVRQPVAIRLYERAGYRATANYPPYEEDPVARCYAKSLKAGVPAG